MMRLLKKVFIDDSALLKFSVLLSIALFCLGWRTSVQAGPNQESNATINTDPIKATASLKLNPLHQGSNSSLRIDLELAPGFHAYLDQFKLNVLEPEGLQLNQLDISPVVEFPDGVSKKIKKGVKGKAQIHTVLGVPEGFPTGTTPAFLELTYQACTLTYCLLPKKIRLPLEFQVSPAFGSVQRLETNSTLDIRENTETDPKTGQKLSPTGKGDESIFVLVQAKGWWLVFVTVFFAGVLTSFTPCVFPMIPITLAVIGSRGPNLSKWRSLLTSLIYVFGIALSYSVLGLFAALTGSLFGSLLGHPLVAVSLALIFLVMALASFGFFEIQAPAFVRRRLGTYQSKSRGMGALLSGLLAGIVAGPCVGPVLVSILAFVVQSQDPLIGFFLLFVFALGMGQIFIALGFFSELIHKIPRSGSWMHFTQFVFGSSLLGLALYYLKPVTPPSLFSFLLGLTLLFVAFTHGRFSRRSIISYREKAKMVFFSLTAVIGFLFIFQALRPNLINNNFPLAFVKNRIPSTGWKPYDPEVLQQALKNQQPVIIDFYADWCVACKELEAITFSDPKVMEKTKDYLLLRFDATQSSPEFEVLRQQFNVLGLPTIVFHDGKSWRQDLTLTGFESPDEFIKRISF